MYMLAMPILHERVMLNINAYAGSNLRVDKASEAVESNIKKHGPKGRRWHTYPLDTELPVQRLLPRTLTHVCQFTHV